MSDAPSTDPAIPHHDDLDHVVVEGGEPVHLADRPVLVVDFGAQYAQLIARRVREASCFSEVVPHSMPVAEMLAKDPAAVILSGGPSSVYEEGAPSLDPALLEAGVPVFGMCYGFQAMARALGGTVEKTGLSEFGATPANILDTSSTLFNGQPADQSVWMSHGDSVSRGPRRDGGHGHHVRSARGRVRGRRAQALRRAVAPRGAALDVRPAGARELPDPRRRPEGEWTAANVVDDLVASVRAQVGDARVICGLSGGVDSSVAAALVQKAVGDQLTCVFVDHGLLRSGEAEQVEKDFVAATGVDLVVVDAKERFLSALAGVSDPEEKRKIIGREFIRVFEQAARDVVGSHSGASDHPVEFLVQGTLYPDVVESGGGTGTANIKSHHNVGGLPDDLQFKLVEPLRLLFKDEVRQVGLELGVPEGIVWRQPFPGPGLGIRIVGEVTARAARRAARGGRDRPRGAHRRWPRPRDLAVPGRAARRRALGRRAGRRPHLRPPGGAAPGVLRGRHDRRLDPGALRRAGEDLHPDHQRGARGEPGRARRDEQAAGHHRVGVRRFGG